MVATPAPKTPITVAVLDDFELVVRGLAALLEPHADRVTVVELDSDLPAGQPVDIGLYDSFALPAPLEEHLKRVAEDPLVARGVVYTWAVTEEVVEEARRRGMAAVLPKTMSAEELVGALERVHAGETLLEPMPVVETDEHEGAWPGQAEGLTARQAEIIALIAEGLSNQEIARRTYLSINSVKSYIRAAYRTMGVASRSQAVLWAVEHDFRRDRRRVVTAAGKALGGPDGPMPARGEDFLP